MKKFLITLALGYAVIAAVLFFTGKKAKDIPGEKVQTKTISSEKAALPKTPKPQSPKTSAASLENKALIRTTSSEEKITPVSGVKTFETYYADGRVSSSWPLRDASLEGNVIFYHPNGAIWMEYPFSKGQETGIEKEYDVSGTVLFEKQMLSGAPQGELRQYYPSGKLWMRATLGIMGFETFPSLFSENGDASSGLLLGSAESASEQGVFRVLSETGAPRAEWIGSGGGLIKTFYDQGSVSSEWPQKEGRPHGMVRFYYPSGNVWKEIMMEGGLLDGTVRTYYPQGQVQRETSYSAGRKNGSAKVFYEDGSLWAEFLFEEGRLLAIPKAYSQGRGEARLPER